MSATSTAAWPDRRVLDLLGLALPIIQAPMAGATTVAMVKGAMRAGALGSLPCAMLTPEQARAAVEDIRASQPGSFNLNFFCHRPPHPDPDRERRWLARLTPYYLERGLDPEAPLPQAERAPFDEQWCALVEEVRPAVVSFHFGLPASALLDRVRATGARILSSATTVAEALWLETQGCDAIIAMGAEAGGHRATFLPANGVAPESALAVAMQPSMITLLPQVVDAVSIPVIAAGGIADGRGVVAAIALGASAVQVGTAYLFTPEASITAAHRQALEMVVESGTAITNLFSGRPARSVLNRIMRELGPMCDDAPKFPSAATALAPLRGDGSRPDFISLWAGQSAHLAPRGLNTEDLTRRLDQNALSLRDQRGAT